MFGLGTQIKKPVFVFTPQPDITAYELAWIIKLMVLPYIDTDKIMKKMPEGCHKHFRIKEDCR
jgi:hypothetical protein